jgi:transposase
MIFNHRKMRVFIYHEAIDMRCGFERLSYNVREILKSNLLEGHVYLFLGKNRRRAKVLLFDGTGLVLISKRLEQGRFMSIGEIKDAHEITTSELGLLLDGSRVRLPVAVKQESRFLV